MDKFIMNGYLWHIEYVHPLDDRLIDREGHLTVATTDPDTMSVYLSDSLSGPFLNRVLIHELGHCVLFSFGLLNDIHRIVPRRNWIDAEEWVCNIIADYGMMIFSIAYSVLGDNAIRIVPYELEKIYL